MSLVGWQRASLPMLVLDVLAAAPRHGYGISQALVAAGLQPVKGAQLYPTLVRLEDEGAVTARWEEGEAGPARKVYELTAPGRDRRAELHSQWQAFITAADAVGPTDEPSWPGNRSQETIVCCAVGLTRHARTTDTAEPSTAHPAASTVDDRN